MIMKTLTDDVVVVQKNSTRIAVIDFVNTIIGSTDIVTERARICTAPLM
jgi:hypothetical protein